jgi:hypothetical protein
MEFAFVQKTKMTLFDKVFRYSYFKFGQRSKADDNLDMKF